MICFELREISPLRYASVEMTSMCVGRIDVCAYRAFYVCVIIGQLTYVRFSRIDVFEYRLINVMCSNNYLI